MTISLTSQIMPSIIKYWRLSPSAYVFPHLVLKEQKSTQKEMIEICKKLKSELYLDIYIYSQDEYCKELNGNWNVCISIKEKDKEKKYTYIIRSCDDYNKTFGCPFVKTYKSGITALTKSENEKIFNIVESKMMEIMPESKKVDYFDV